VGVRHIGLGVYSYLNLLLPSWREKGVKDEARLKMANPVWMADNGHPAAHS
jgi:hypothetical protein